MLSPMYINTRIDYEKYALYSFGLHRKKLKEIKSKIPTRNYSAPKLLKRSKPLISQQILRDNKKIVRKLIEIANEKRNTRPLTPIVSTLNYANRKKEYERIDQENKKLIAKIQSCVGDVSQESFQKEFTQSQEYKNRISRAFILKKRNSNPSRSERPTFKEKSPSNCFSAVDLLRKIN